MAGEKIEWEIGPWAFGGDPLATIYHFHDDGTREWCYWIDATCNICKLKAPVAISMQWSLLTGKSLLQCFNY